MNFVHSPLNRVPWNDNMDIHASSGKPFYGSRPLHYRTNKMDKESLTMAWILYFHWDLMKAGEIDVNLAGSYHKNIPNTHLNRSLESP